VCLQATRLHIISWSRASTSEAVGCYAYCLSLTQVLSSIVAAAVMDLMAKTLLDGMHVQHYSTCCIPCSHGRVSLNVRAVRLVCLCCRPYQVS
jgi:hypothetical protein